MSRRAQPTDPDAARRARNAEYMRRWRAKNPEKVREWRAKYRAENREKVREADAKYRAEHPEKVRERDARYRAENREKVREWKRRNSRRRLGWPPERLDDPPADPVARFWAKVDKSGGPDACWLWTGARQPTGYGLFRVQSRTRGAHRFSYELARGPIPAGLVVMHRCDNPPCVNPAHLTVGTQGDNIRDAVAKGRQVVPTPPRRKKKEA